MLKKAVDRYEYVESGLRGFVLKGVSLHVCKSRGEEEVTIPMITSFSVNPAACKTKGPRISFSDTIKSNSERRIHSNKPKKFRCSLQESVLEW
jgi:hypothetical protein